MRTGGTRFGYFFFDLQGPALVGYTLFAVALGMFAGALVKRTLPAMALTLTGYLVIRFAVEVLVRPNFLPLPHRTWPLTLPPTARTRTTRSSTNRPAASGCSNGSRPASSCSLPPPCSPRRCTGSGAGSRSLTRCMPSRTSWSGSSP